MRLNAMRNAMFNWSHQFNALISSMPYNARMCIYFCFSLSLSRARLCECVWQHELYSRRKLTSKWVHTLHNFCSNIWPVMSAHKHYILVYVIVCVCVCMFAILGYGFWSLAWPLLLETDRHTKFSIGILMNSIKINNHDLMQTDEFNSETLSMDRN